MSLTNNKYYDICMFHYPCPDGLASAWIVKHYHDTHNQEIKLYPISHGKIIDYERLKNKSIIMCDYAPDYEALDIIEKSAVSIIILDHHITAQKTLERKSYGIFDMSLSGAGLTWDFFHPDIKKPNFIEMIQDRDLWQWKIDGSKEFTSGFSTVCSTFNQYDFNSLFDLYNKLYLSETDISFYIELGKIISKITDNKAKTLGENHLLKISEYIFNEQVYKVCIINCPADIASETGNFVSAHENVDFAVLWMYNNPSDNYYVSLRSCGDVDISIIAKSFGGGGHKNASGFSTKVFPPILFNSLSNNLIELL